MLKFVTNFTDSRKILIGVFTILLVALNKRIGLDLSSEDIAYISGIAGSVILGLGMADFGKEKAKGDAPVTTPEDPKVTEAKNFLKSKGVTVVALLAAFSVASGCALVPKQENVDAIRTTATQLQDLSAKSEKIYTIGIDGLAKKLRQKAKESNDNYIGYLRAKAQIDPAHMIALTGDQELAFVNQQKTLDAEADAAIDSAVSAVKDHNVHQQMHDLSAWLNQWLFQHLSSEEQNAQIAKQAHDLLFKPKEVK